ncbi:unnamed protein product [Prorocentrum cordatum]|uniref:Uncharacterized protein n=1 Tax=Prorocentrum cordatum TaxID=2364126 RepID=A0ABN9UHB1_9DINO|nr:unnamed protein product [Polarella glacialis]
MSFNGDAGNPVLVRPTSHRTGCRKPSPAPRNHMLEYRANAARRVVRRARATRSLQSGWPQINPTCNTLDPHPLRPTPRARAPPSVEASAPWAAPALPSPAEHGPLPRGRSCAVAALPTEKTRWEDGGGKARMGAERRSGRAGECGPQRQLRLAPAGSTTSAFLAPPRSRGTSGRGTAPGRPRTRARPAAPWMIGSPPPRPPPPRAGGPGERPPRLATARAWPTAASWSTRASSCLLAIGRAQEQKAAPRACRPSLAGASCSSVEARARVTSGGGLPDIIASLQNQDAKVWAKFEAAPRKRVARGASTLPLRSPVPSWQPRSAAPPSRQRLA